MIRKMKWMKRMTSLSSKTKIWRAGMPAFFIYKTNKMGAFRPFLIKLGG